MPEIKINLDGGSCIVIAAIFAVMVIAVVGRLLPYLPTLIETLKP